MHAQIAHKDYNFKETLLPNVNIEIVHVAVTLSDYLVAKF